jgi:hypothetical protein
MHILSIDRKSRFFGRFYIFMIDSKAPIPDDETDVESVRDLEVSLDLAEIAPETI